MKKFYFVEDNIQKGPYSLEELINARLDENTLVWCVGMEDWRTFNSIRAKFLSEPPPIPSIHTNDEKLNLKPTRNQLLWFLVWIAIHSLILLYSTNNENRWNYRDDGFWPFVQFTATFGNDPSEMGYHKEFLGIFTDYYSTEYFVYIGAWILIYLILKLGKAIR
jgi:hypothetical protein